MTAQVDGHWREKLRPRGMISPSSSITHSLYIIKPLDAINPFEWFNYPEGLSWKEEHTYSLESSKPSKCLLLQLQLFFCLHFFIITKLPLHTHTKIPQSILMLSPRSSTVSILFCPFTPRHPSVAHTQQSLVFLTLCGLGCGFFPPFTLSFIRPDPITDKEGRGKR